jgi:DNA-binding CsgD family transcriptional regulator
MVSAVEFPPYNGSVERFRRSDYKGAFIINKINSIMTEIPGSKGEASESSRNPVNEIVDLKNPELLRKLYCTEGKSLKQIAALASTTKSDVHYWMVKHGIARREWSANTPKCDPKQIHELYWNQGKTIREIAKLRGISFTTARKHLLRETTSSQLRSRWTVKYRRMAFSEDELERAYLLGLRSGDLNAAKTSLNSVMARVSTTHPAMVELFTRTLDNYGHCSLVTRIVFLTGYGWQGRTYLDNSFSFLIDKPKTVPTDEMQFYAFVAGLSDSDGSWVISHDEARLTFTFLITTEESLLIRAVKTMLESIGLHPTLRMDQKSGTTKTTKIMHGVSGARKITLSRDMWVLRLHRLGEVSFLAAKILPLSRHKEKIEKMRIILDSKTRDWQAVEPLIVSLRSGIRNEVVESIRKAEIEYKARHPGAAIGAGSSARPTLNSIQLGASLV